MTDDELIALIEETPVEQLSLEQIEMIRARVAGSSALRAAMAGHLAFEQRLHAALGRPVVEVDAIIARVEPRRKAVRALRVLATIAAAGGALAFVVWMARSPTVRQPESVTHLSPLDGVEHDTSVANPTSIEPPADSIDSAIVDPVLEIDDADSATATSSPTVSEPWGASLAAEAKPFDRTCFVELATPTTQSAEMLKRWWQVISGAKPAIQNKPLGLMLKGVYRLRSPFRAGTALRVSFAPNAEMRLHVWSGSKGVTLALGERPRLGWAGYLAEREPRRPLPRRLSFIGVDENRFQRTGRGVVEVRWQDGLVVLSRGDILLFAAPLATPPEHVILESTTSATVLTGLDLIASAPFPLDESQPVEGPKLAGSHSWKTFDQPGSEFHKAADGSVQLAANRPSQTARAWFPLASVSPQQIVFAVDEVQPGAGIYLGDQSGQPLVGVEYAISKRHGQLMFGFVNPTQSGTNLDESGSPPHPLANGRQWLRLIVARDAVKCEASGDGVHWRAALEPFARDERPIVTVGLYVRAASGASGLQVSHVADEHIEAFDLADARKSLSNDGPLLAHDLRSLSNLARLRDTRDAATAGRLFDAIVDLGHAAFHAGHRRPYWLVHQQLYDAPLDNLTNVTLPPDFLVQREILNLIESGDWQALDQTCASVRFFKRAPHAGSAESITELAAAEYGDTMRLVDWAAAQGESLQTSNPAGSSGAWVQPLHRGSRHPLVEPFSRDEFNILSEFQSAVAAGSFKDACEIVVSLKPTSDAAIISEGDDADLFVSLRTAIAAAMRDNTDLRETMIAEFGRVAQVELSQAVRDNNVPAIESIPLRFPATSASADAEMALGDRELARNDILLASIHYAAARKVGGSAWTDLSARLRLVAAMQGDAAESPVLDRVRLGEVTLESDEFEQMILRLHNRAAKAGLTSNESNAAASVATKPARYSVRAAKASNISEAPAREVAAVMFGERLLIENQTQNACYDLIAKQPVWATKVDKSSDPPRWKQSSMTPRWSANGVFTRRATSTGAEVVCLDPAAGLVRWRTSPRLTFVTDPIVLGENVLAIAFDSGDEDTLHLQFVHLDAGTGRVRTRSPFVVLRNSWQGRPPCEATIAGDTFLFVGGGCVIAASLDGRVQWLRRQPWVANLLAVQASASRSTSPLVIGGSVCVWQPGSAGISCLDLVTGRVRWQRVMPGTDRLVALTTDTILLQTTDGLSAIDATTGKTRWFYPSRTLLEPLAASPSLVLFAEGDARASQRAAIQLQWIDSASGNRVARSQLDVSGLRQFEPGPLIAPNNKLWLLSTGDGSNALRLFELVEQGPALKETP
jgi:hypothetical protein